MEKKKYTLLLVTYYYSVLSDASVDATMRGVGPNRLRDDSSATRIRGRQVKNRSTRDALQERETTSNILCIVEEL